MICRFIAVDDDEAIDAASQAASEAYRNSSPQKSKTMKLNKVQLPSPSPLPVRIGCFIIRTHIACIDAVIVSRAFVLAPTLLG